MLILLRHPPDDRVRDLILAACEESGSASLVYLERALHDPLGHPPLVLAGQTYTMDPPAIPGIKQIDGQLLLTLIRGDSRILVLP